MPRTRYHLTEHAALDTIPLRIGVVPSSRKVYLDSLEEDPDGTAGQRPKEIQNGRKHELADVWTEREGGECWGRWRIVTAPVDDDGKDQPVLTVLPLDRDAAKTAGNLTDFLSNLRKSGEVSWLTPQYVATTLHEMVKSGQITNQAQLAGFIQSKRDEQWQEATSTLAREKDALQDKLEKAKAGMTELAKQAMEASARAQQAQENERSALEKLERALKSQAASSNTNAADGDPSEAQELKAAARRVTEQWRSMTKNSAYVNVGIDAYIEDVTQKGTRIYLTYIDGQGRSKQINDFGFINGFVSGVYDYLLGRKGQRAVFLLTQKPGDTPMLASDTMMLDC